MKHKMGKLTKIRLINAIKIGVFILRVEWKVINEMIMNTLGKTYNGYHSLLNMFGISNALH